MPRAIWSGSIAFGLVNAPVKMYSAIDEHDLELHLVHEKDGSPIGYEKVCKKEGREVPANEIVKAYEVEDGELVYLEEEDFEAAEEEGYRTIQVLDFVQREEIDPIVFQRSYYLGPAEGAEKVYLVLVRAMEDSGLSAIVEYVFQQKQQLGCLRVREGLILLEAMYFADEIRPVKGIAPKRSSKLDKRELEMAQTLIDRFTSDFDHGKYEDEYRKRLLKIVKRKLRGEEVHAPPRERQEAPSDLLEALRASVEAAKGVKNGRSKRHATSRRRPKARKR
ncbi:MAG: Ku protein [Actinobacteria bacterium]|nr:Ku protein [Actinomycetota bacterium]